MSDILERNDAALEQAAQIAAEALENNAKRPEVKAFFHTETNTVSYVVYDRATMVAAVIDSVLDYDQDAARTDYSSADEIIEYVKSKNLTVEWVMETHAHADHLSAAPYIQEKLGGKLAIGAHITTVQNVFGKLFNAGTEFERDGSQFDHLFSDGETFKLGSIDAVALHVPGHTPADMAYVIGDAVFLGDTMFMPDYGTARADFPGGDAGQLFRSIRRLLALSRETRLFMCHDYLPSGRTEYVWETTVGAQRDGNVHAHDGVSEDEFVGMRTARDATLAVPKLILPSVQVNIRAGHFPAPEENGVSYIKIPVNQL
jgi:glyoxylase-like metal-dependent hydrolase (beta-lactamase superfamily II)